MSGEWSLNNIKSRVVDLEAGAVDLEQEVDVTDLVAIYILAKA